MTIGIDEVGRGCWAGPLVVAAVRLGYPLSGLADSKDLSPIKRSDALKTIQSKASDIKVATVSVEEIDRDGLSQAMRGACEQLFLSISKQLGDKVIIDGNVNYLANEPSASAQIKADASVPAVMAASIVAKQSRDAYMKDLASKFPEFDWHSNVGYGTKAHQQALAKYGVTRHHRQSFKPIRNYVSIAGEYRRK